MESGGRESSQPMTTLEEEAVKKNTDCVYFLASPLTCKKGNECEYRHSEAARINPRDCWYWLNGNCLNPKCSFRHPPLDALLGTPGTTPPGSSLALPPQQNAMPSQIPAVHSPAAYNSNKQSVACIYFQKGLCLKGDRCPFKHGPAPVNNLQPINNPISQQFPKVATSVTEPLQGPNKFGGLEKCTSKLKTPRVNSSLKQVEVPTAAKPAPKLEVAPNNGIVAKKILLPLIPKDEELPRSQPTKALFIDENSVSRPRSRHPLPFDERLQNGREAGEFLGESPPGFDVLVDNALEDSDYFLDKEEFRTLGHGKRPGNEFNYGHSDYDSLAKFDREPRNDLGDYDDPYGLVQDRLGWENRRASSERIFERPSIPERRGLPREGSPEQISRSDLRHRLSKQRRIDGSRSAVSPDRRGEFYPRDDRYAEDHKYRSSSRRDHRHFPTESSISNRLQGRIALPRRSSPDNPNDMRFERETDKGRNWNRTSPGRSVSYQGRQHDRIKRRMPEDFAMEVRNSWGQSIRKDEIGTSNFASPKSLAELKGSKVSDSSEERSAKSSDTTGLRSRAASEEQKNAKMGKFSAHQESEGPLLFEGPKPLSVILKRKREADSGNSMGYDDREESQRRETLDFVGTSVIVATETCNIQSVEFDKEAEGHILGNYEEPKATPIAGPPVEEEEEEDLANTEDDGLVHDGEALKGDKLEMDTMEDQELEKFNHRDGDFDYDQTVEAGGDCKTEDENADQDDEEYLDDEDGDDFARRMGVMFS